MTAPRSRRPSGYRKARTGRPRMPWRDGCGDAADDPAMWPLPIRIRGGDLPRTALMASLAASAVLAGATAPAVLAAGAPGFGQHVAGCAHADLGARPAPPTVTCGMPDGTTMSFANFGAMVRHMHDMGS